MTRDILPVIFKIVNTRQLGPMILGLAESKMFIKNCFFQYFRTMVMDCFQNITSQSCMDFRNWISTFVFVWEKIKNNEVLEKTSSIKNASTWIAFVRGK